MTRKDLPESIINLIGPLHCIYFDWFLDIRAGGPTGYLANLKNALDLTNNSFKEKIFFACRGKTNISAMSPKIKKFTPLSSQLNDLWSVKEIRNSIANPTLLNDLFLSQVKTIHCHTVFDVIKVHNFFLKKPEISKPKIILSAHSPESIGQEQYDYKVSLGYDPSIALKIKKEWQQIEELAFFLSDIWIFPSYEAMEPAREFVPNFQFMEQDKDIRFVKTGVKSISDGEGRKKIRAKYSIPENAKVVGFLGRHNEIKGYDILKGAAGELLKTDSNLYFLLGGSVSEIPPLKNNRWIECGRVDPKDFLDALDLFVLPNRKTYYDLIFLEVISRGIPILAANNGGNISLSKDIPSVLTFNCEIKSLVMEINNFFNIGHDERLRISKELKAAYLNDFDLQAFGERYINCIRSIHSDY